MKKENMKSYEAPTLKVTELQTKDIIMTSGALITLDGDKLLGSGRVEWIDVQ